MNLREREHGRQNQIALVLYLSESNELARNSISLCPCFKNLCEPKKNQKEGQIRIVHPKVQQYGETCNTRWEHGMALGKPSSGWMDTNNGREQQLEWEHPDLALQRAHGRVHVRHTPSSQEAGIVATDLEASLSTHAHRAPTSTNVPPAPRRWRRGAWSCAARSTRPWSASRQYAHLEIKSIQRMDFFQRGRER